MVQYDVPFIENPNTRCVVATIGMVLAYFMPERRFTMAQLEKLCGYREGFGSWPVEHMLRLHDMGFELRWIEQFDHAAFANNPKAYLQSILKDPEALEWQLTHSDLPKEAARMRTYMDKRLPLENRPGTIKDITQMLDDGWLVRLEVNSKSLVGQSGYEGHSVLVIGYDKEGAIIHNPDGAAGNRPAQHVAWPLLKRAWREFGGSYSLYAFRRLKV